MNDSDKIPDDWMKVLVVDPGTARAGLLCLAVPPPPTDLDGPYFPQYIHAYAERMLYNANAAAMAKEAKELTGDTKFELFLIDKRAGKQTPMGFNHTVREQYALEFKAHGVRSRLTDYDFQYTSDDVEGREMLLKEWMQPRVDLRPVLKIHNHLHDLPSQMNGFFRKKGDPLKRQDRVVLELVHCLEYAAAHFNGTLYYNDPEPVDEVDTLDSCVRLFREFEKKDWQLTEKPKPPLNFGCNGSG